ncbi:hypothetical protein [Pseudomonas sp. GD03746]|uniref:hypothetical protein n=1 Tax=Pseudomonas sp. GD03746 TaxID=2975378 RepID=UPI0024498EFF|nr:hypothetical protein [Pseudomonas sp. GD03746]MDH1574181.1 hypothetical protein [Pseudomonas sp. GD03746]
MVDRDKSYILFSSVFMAVTAKKYKAGTSHAEAEDFVQHLFDEYINEGLEAPTVDWIVAAPKKAVTWITSRLANSFRCYGASPKWVDEPSWRFLGNTPMDFVHQFEVEGCSSGDRYEGLMTYVFFGQKDCQDDGWEMVVKLVQQYKNEPGTILVD